MRIASSKETSERINLLLPARSKQRLDVLKEETEATSYAEVFKNALRLYEALLKECSSGSKIYIEDKDKKLKELPLFMFS